MGPFESQVAAIAENIRVDFLTKEFLAKLRADIDTLAKNLFTIKTDDDVKELSAAMSRFSSYLSQMFDEKGDQNALVPSHAAPGSILSALQKKGKELFPNDSTRADAFFYRWKHKIQNAVYELSVGLRFTVVPEWRNIETKIAEIDRKVAYKIIMDRADALCGVLRNLITNVGFSSSPSPIAIKTNVEKRATVAGFPAKIVGYDSSDPDHVKGLKIGQMAVEEFVKRAKDRFPELLRYMQKIAFQFYCPSDSEGQVLGYYSRNTDGEVNVCCTNLARALPNVTSFVQTIAHETGHRLFYALPKEMVNLWNAAVSSDGEPLDLDEIVDNWPKAVTKLDPAVKAIAKKNIHAAVQLAVLLTTGAKNEKGQKVNNFFMNRAEFVDFADEIRDKGWHLFVPAHPVSLYGLTNTSETFAEVVGNLVAYGPRTIPPPILNLFRIVTDTN